MLVVTLRKDEVVWIGDQIFIAPTKSQEQRIRVGIHAPKEVAIHRAKVGEEFFRGARGVSAEREPSRLRDAMEATAQAETDSSVAGLAGKDRRTRIEDGTRRGALE